MRNCGLAMLILALVAGLSIGKPAPAAEIETRITPEMAQMGCSIRLVGPLAEGDLDRLTQAVARVPPEVWDSPKPDLAPILRAFAPALDYGEPIFTHRLCLDSPGGSMAEAVRLAEFLRAHAARSLSGLPTAIARGDRCAGACALVFLAGRFVRFPGVEHYDGPSSANALLNPEGVLDLAGLIPPGPEGAAAAAGVLTLVAEGTVFMDLDLLALAILRGEGPGLQVETVGQALRWGIEIEPTPLQLGSDPGPDDALVTRICQHAAQRLPSHLSLVDGQGTGWQDRRTGRHYDCAPGAQALGNLRALRSYPPDPEHIFARLHFNCQITAEFRLAAPCDGFDCDGVFEVELPCAAAYPPDLPLTQLAVPLPGN